MGEEICAGKSFFSDGTCGRAASVSVSRQVRPACVFWWQTLLCHYSRCISSRPTYICTSLVDLTLSSLNAAKFHPQCVSGGSHIVEWKVWCITAPPHQRPSDGGGSEGPFYCFKGHNALRRRLIGNTHYWWFYMQYQSWVWVHVFKLNEKMCLHVWTRTVCSKYRYCDKKRVSLQVGPFLRSILRPLFTTNLRLTRRCSGIHDRSVLFVSLPLTSLPSRSSTISSH